MVTFGAPLYLIIAGGVAVLVIALHLLNPRVRRNEPFPTARFIPEAPASFEVRRRQITDLILLLLRVAIVLLIGTALAQPRVHRPTRTTAQVAVTAQGSLSAALVNALREASRLRDSADSVEIIISAPFVQSQADAATSTIRALWPGAIQVVRAPVAQAVRTVLPAQIEWVDSTQSAFWRRRLHTDTVDAVRVGDRVLIAPVVRAWELDSVQTAKARVVARWIDGAPAAIEVSHDNTCTRSIAFGFPTLGDYPLRPGFAEARADLVSPDCKSQLADVPMGSAEIAMLTLGSPRVAATLIAPSDRGNATLRVTLIGLALLLSIIELWLRRRHSQVQT